MPPIENNHRTHDDFGQPFGPNPHHRIGALEGAIKGALPYLEQLCSLAYSHAQEAPCFESDVEDGRQVIANLKELIGNNQ